MYLGALKIQRGIIMKTLLVLVLSCFLASSVFAVIDPDPNMLGIYFDVNANENCLFVEVNAPFFAYLILTNSTAPAINAYEFGFTNCVCTGLESQLFMLASNIAHGVVAGVDVGTHTPTGGDYIVGLAEALPATEAIILHSWQYMLTAILPVQMLIGPSSKPSLPDGLPVVQNAEGSILMSVGTSTGGPDIPVATLNTDCVVAIQSASWGNVKALYR
jgi:hypothetical protein